MEKENKKTIEVPFVAKDSEMYKFEYTIPEGYEAEIKEGKVIVRKKESEDERIRKRLIDCLKFSLKGAEEQDAAGCSRQKDIEAYKWGIAYLEKQKEQKPAEWSEEELDKARKCLTVVWSKLDDSQYNIPERYNEKLQIDRLCLIWIKDILQKITINV